MQYPRDTGVLIERRPYLKQRILINIVKTDGVLYKKKLKNYSHCSKVFIIINVFRSIENPRMRVFNNYLVFY